MNRNRKRAARLAERAIITYRRVWLSAETEGTYHVEFQSHIRHREDCNDLLREIAGAVCACVRTRMPLTPSRKRPTSGLQR